MKKLQFLVIYRLWSSAVIMDPFLAITVSGLRSRLDMRFSVYLCFTKTVSPSYPTTSIITDFISNFDLFASSPCT